VTDRIELGVSQADDCPSPAKIASDEALETRIAVIVDDDDDVVRQVKFVVQRRAAIVKNTQWPHDLFTQKFRRDIKKAP
jgi:hypothetical protein